MDKCLSLFFLLLSATINSGAQSVTQQKYRQQFAEAQVAATPAIAVQKAKIALKFFNQLKNKPIAEQIELYSLLYHSLAANGQDQEALKVAMLSYQKVNQLKGYESPQKIDLIYDIGFLYSRMENYFEAINYYKKSLALYIKTNGEVSDEVALNYNNLAHAYRRVYNQKFTIAYYTKAARIWEQVYANKADPNDYLIMVYQNLIAELLWYGALDEAKDINHKLNSSFYKKYSAKSSRNLATYFDARQLMVLGNVRTLAASGNFSKAKLYCDSLRRETKFTAENKDDIAFVVNCYTFISDYTYDEEDYAQTIAVSNLVALDAEKYDLKQQKMIINAKLGTTYEKLGDFKKALYHINLADENANKQSFNSSKFSIQIIKAKILQGQGLANQALHQARNTIAQILSEKVGKKATLKNVNFDAIKDLASEGFINIFLSAGHVYLESYQKSKSKSQLADAQKLLTLAGQLFQEYYAKGEFNETLAYYHQRIIEGLLTTLSLKAATLEDKVQTLDLIERNASQHLLKEYDKKIKRSNPSNRGYLDQISNLKLELAFYQDAKSKEQEIIKLNTSKKESIRKQIALLTRKIAETEKNYVVFNASNFSLKDVLGKLNSDEQLLKYYVTENLIFSVLIGKEGIELRHIKRRPIVEQQLERFIAQTKTVASDFKGNAANLYSLLVPSGLKQHVTIIPDNFLNYIPFETLYDKRTKQFLVQQKVIAYDYSLPMWLLHRRDGQSYSTNKLAAFSPNYTGLSNKQRDSGYTALKFAGLEAATIANLFQGDLFKGEQASKDAFIARLQKYGVFHLSMHSQLYEDDFNKSFLLFGNNEKLYFSELYGMHIPALMVVLSACNTGSGLLRSGEGIMSLSRALTYAGVQSAVVSLWQVPDQETSEIMVSFYENLKKGQSKSEALANSKKKFITENPMKNHPFYWAGFVVNGDTSAIYTPYQWWYIAFGFIGVLLVLTFIFRKPLIKLRK